MVDTTDLKSVGRSRPCRFESGPRHLFNEKKLLPEYASLYELQNGIHQDASRLPFFPSGLGMIKHVLVTGGAGFIGSNLCLKFLATGWRVTCLDNFDPFYSPQVKQQNIEHLYAAAGSSGAFICHREDIRNYEWLQSFFRDNPVDGVIHLAALAGVRPSIARPLDYNAVNVQGTLHLLECCRQFHVQNFVFGSSSSVYGERQHGPFSENDDVGKPVSPYAATKRAGELWCFTYAHLYRMHVACLRFFTVYGPRQRPDLAIHKFARLMAAGQSLPLYGDGTSQRDYTYVDDIVDGILQAWAWVEQADTTQGICEIFNLGGSHPTSLLQLVRLLEQTLACQAKIDWQPAQPGDVSMTFADVSKAEALLDYHPRVDIYTGLQRFAAWFKQSAL